MKLSTLSKEDLLVELKRMFDKAYLHGDVTRERAANDMIFYHLTQWDDTLESSTLGYKGEFNILKKAGRSIMADSAENPVQADFHPKNDTPQEAADLLDGIYRTEDNINSTLEAYEIAEHEAIVCGVGAWELYTQYDSLKPDNQNQSIKRRPLFEANNTVFWDPGAKRMDKSDAKWVFILSPYSEEGYEDLVKELTGEEVIGENASNFKDPEHSYTFPWFGNGGKTIYVGKCYYREKIKVKHLTMIDPFGEEVVLKESDLKDVMDEMIDEGYEIESEKEVDEWRVTQYIMSGDQVLDESQVVGSWIPVIPQYGEYAIIEGELHYEGITRLAKDPSRLRNAAMSYLADILFRSGRPKPIFYQEQIGRFAHMYEENGADNNYPYLLMETPKPSDPWINNPIGIMPEQTVPQSLDKVLIESRNAVEDVASAGMVPDVADVDLSGKALNALNARIDKQSFTYQLHKKHAKRHDSRVYASMAIEVYDVPRKVLTTSPDGTKKETQIMESVIDNETGDLVVLNDLSGAEFEFFSTIGPSYSSQKEHTVEQLTQMYTAMAPGDPMRKAVELKLVTMIDGPDFEDLKDYARKQLIIMGFKEPETDEEKKMLEDQQKQAKEPSAEMVLAQGELLKGQAAKEKNQIEIAKIQANAQNEAKKRIIDEFGEVTKRASVQVDAQEAGANIDYKRADTMHKRMETAAKKQEMDQLDFEKMDDSELFKHLTKK